MDLNQNFDHQQPSSYVNFLTNQNELQPHQPNQIEQLNEQAIVTPTLNNQVEIVGWILHKV